MAVILNPGRVVKGYSIVQKLNQGAFALAYQATGPDGEPVFFKSYKLPGALDDWYRGYIAYQDELKRRIETSRFKDYTYRFLDFFEEKVGCPTYFQVFEWVEAGVDLEKLMEDAQRYPEALTWPQRLAMARTLMAGIDALHEARIVHCDLKPSNICLIRKPTGEGGYTLKIVDLDFSIMVDRKAPWDQIEGYVGTPRYFSPEHLRGAVPTRASDVFTCGLILYELLTGGHPYPLDDDDYRKAVQGHRAPPPALRGALPEEVSAEEIRDILRRCLDPEAENRPKAKEVLQALCGQAGASPGALELRTEGGKTLRADQTVNLIGRYLLEARGEAAGAFDFEQMVLVQVPGEGWFVEPNPRSVNETLLNGRALFEKARLADGDILAVGSEARNVVRHPMAVRIVP
jgi:serine/threonine protein kinase